MLANRSVFIAIIFALALSLLVSFSGFYGQYLNADSNMVFFSSFIRWKPYFWWQDRYGMILPALILWIRAPLANLIVLNILHDLTAWLCFFAGARYLFGKDNWLIPGALAVTGFCVFSRSEDLLLYLTTWQIYSPAILFGFLGLIFLESNAVAGFALLSLSNYANFSTAFLLFALVSTRFFEQLRVEGWATLRKKAPSYFIALLLSTLFGHYLRMNLAEHHSNYEPVHSVFAVTGWLFFFRDDWQLTHSACQIVFAFPALFILTKYLSSQRQPILWPNLVAALSGGILYLMVIGSSAFAERNGYPRRYLIPFLILYAVVWAGPIAQQIDFSSRRLLVALSTTAFLALGFRTGPPSLQALREGLQTRYEAAYKSLKDTGCTHITGDYYRAWDSVFYDRILGHRNLWAIANRAQEVEDLWQLKNFSNPRVCYWKDDTENAVDALKEFHIENLKPRGLKNGLVVLE